MGWFKNIVNNVVDAVSDTASNVGQAVGGVVQDAAPYIGALIPGVGLTALAAEKTGLNNGGGLVGGMSDGFQTAAPYYGAAAAGALGQYYMAPALFGTAATAGAPATAGLLSTGGGGLTGAMGAGSVSSVAANSAGNVINDDPMFRGIGTAALAGAASGGVASAFTPAVSNGLQGMQLGERAANTAAGALTTGGMNAGLQYATTGEVNPIGVITSGVTGGVKGYNTAPVVNTNLYSGYLNGGLNANNLDSSTGSASLLGGDSGLSVDASFAPAFNSSYAAPSYYPTTNPGLSLMNGDSGLMVDPELAPDFKSTYDTGIQPTTQVGVDPKIKVPYDKLIKAGLAAFGGGTAAAAGTSGTSGTAASSYAPKTFTPWDKLADFKTLGSTPSTEDTQEDNTFGLNSSFGANWYNYA